MSRTYRNRRSVPPGYEVRDGGREALRGERGGLIDSDAAWPRAYRRNIWRSESAPARRVHGRWYRHLAKMLVRGGRDEEIPPFRGTCGYLTH